MSVNCFYFQAEDGIRDIGVTGVQTCALPIFGGRLFDEQAVASAILAAIAFCLLSSGFYLINDVRDLEADRLHPIKRLRPLARSEKRRVWKECRSRWSTFH